MKKITFILIVFILTFSCKGNGNIYPSNSKKVYLSYLKKKGIVFNELTLDQLIDSSVSFFKEIRFQKVNLKKSGDMILVQWGKYNWGKGEYLEFDITRQFIKKNKDGDDAMSQLHITLYYSVDLIKILKNENKWFRDPNDTKSIKSYILNKKIYKLLKDKKPIKRKLEWGII